jgi:thioredoxin reductase
VADKNESPALSNGPTQERLYLGGLTRQPMKALIIGGGIGGLSAAIALRRVGIEGVVFEQADELREVGAGLSVWTNAVKGFCFSKVSSPRVEQQENRRRKPSHHMIRRSARRASTNARQ